MVKPKSITPLTISSELSSILTNQNSSAQFRESGEPTKRYFAHGTVENLSGGSSRVFPNIINKENSTIIFYLGKILFAIGKSQYDENTFPFYSSENNAVNFTVDE